MSLPKIRGQDFAFFIRNSRSKMYWREDASKMFVGGICRKGRRSLRKKRFDFVNGESRISFWRLKLLGEK